MLPVLMNSKMNSLKLWIIQVDLCSQDHMWKNVTDQCIKTLLYSLFSTLFSMRVSAIKFFFWAEQLLRAAICISSRPRELLLTAAMQDPASIPDQSAAELRRRVYQLTTQSKEQVGTELLSLQRKGRPVSSTCCFSSDCCFIFTVLLQFHHKLTINEKYYIWIFVFQIMNQNSH